MKNLELLKEEYIGFMKRFDEINIKILDAVDKDKEYKRYPSFVDNEAPDWIYSKYDYDYCEEINDIEDITDEEYNKSVEEAVLLRNKLFEEKYKVSLEFEQWRMKTDLTYEEIRSFGNIERVEMKWRGWDSSDYTYETMIYSVNLTDEEEVDKIIANMEKVLTMINLEDECGYCESLEYIEYLRIVNNETRHGMNEYCMTTMALDIMENHGIYNSYCESFKECILNIAHLVDREFLFYAEHTPSLN